MGTPPPRPDVRAKSSSRKRRERIFLAVMLLVILAAFVAVNISNDCETASTAALAVIETGAEDPPLNLVEGKSLESTIIFADGRSQPGVLVGARTPTGVGVWIMDEGSYSGSGSGLVYAANTEARVHTIWGEDTNFDPAPTDDVEEVEGCV